MGGIKNKLNKLSNNNPSKGSLSLKGAAASSGSNFSNVSRESYVDLYYSGVFTSDDLFGNNNQCTWAICGGHAFYETKNVQSVDAGNQSWEGNDSRFANSGYAWFKRGGSSVNGVYLGLFYTFVGNGETDEQAGFRVALTAS